MHGDKEAEESRAEPDKGGDRPGRDKKDHARVRIFPPAVPLVVVLAGVFLKRIWPADLGLPTPARYWIGGLVIAGAFFALGGWSVALFKRSGQSANPWKPTPEIVAHGPYRISRNPMYLQMVIGCLGFAILLSNLWILLLTPLCVWGLNTLAIRPEEAYLAEKFGDDYAEYKRRVRRWI